MSLCEYQQEAYSLKYTVRWIKNHCFCRDILGRITCPVFSNSKFRKENFTNYMNIYIFFLQHLLEYNILEYLLL